MAAYRRVYDSRHLQADCQEPGSAPEPYTLGNRVLATFTFFTFLQCLTLCEKPAAFVTEDFLVCVCDLTTMQYALHTELQSLLWLYHNDIMLSL